MSMNTPIGNITQTTPIKDFKELDEMQNEQYLLGIDNNAVGNGSKISLENLINSSISTDSDNLITKGTDDRLLVNTPIEIGDLSDLTTTDKSTLVAAINEVDSNIAIEVTNRVNAVSGEATIRANADNNLQSQIDAITAASDVTDVVGTYAELQAYDTTGLADKSVIKVLKDESRQNETTYYRWVITDGVGAWVLIGEEGPYPTIAYVDGKFATQETTGNLANLDTSDKTSLVNAINELSSVLDPTQTADYINNSKGLKSGEVSTNSIILNAIKDYAHSTFDRSKFAVVGSPNITDNGIASGFSSSNYINTIQLSELVDKSWDIEDAFEYTPLSSGNATLLGLTPTYAVRGSIYYNSRGDVIFGAYVGVTGNTTSEGPKITLSNLLTNAGVYYYKLSFDIENGKYTLSIYDSNHILINSGEYTPLTTNKQLWDINNNPTIYISLGKGLSGALEQINPIDLKQFSIAVDGVEVFSGNKTGIDTIKPDNYTVVGTPTISADGIASGFSSSNYLRTPTIDFTKPWEIITKFNQKAIQASCLWYVQGGGWFNNIYVGNNNDNLSFAFKLSDNSEHNLKISYTRSLDTTYKYKIGWTGTSYYVKFYDENDTLIEEHTFDSTLTISSTSGWVQLGFGSNGNYIFNGSIDLNAFKIYVDGNLVYQPCLKIPYTESFTGSKIAQAIYRNRVVDAYEQGYHQYSYYTLSDTDFTLPMGEVYGMIGRLDKLLNNEIGLPIPTLSNTLNENEIWLEGAEVSKTTYWKLYNIYGDSYGTPDSTDNFVLPDFRNRTLWGADSFGYISAGLPNITGYLDVFTSNGVQQNGALSKNIRSERNPGGGNELGWGTIQFDASRSSSVYGNSTTVQPPAIKVRYKTRYC